MKELIKSLWEKLPIEMNVQDNSFRCPNCQSELSPDDFGFDEQKLNENESFETNKENVDKWSGLECPECGEHINLTEYEYNPLDG